MRSRKNEKRLTRRSKTLTNLISTSKLDTCVERERGREGKGKSDVTFENFDMYLTLSVHAPTTSPRVYVQSHVIQLAVYLDIVDATCYGHIVCTFPLTFSLSPFHIFVKYPATMYSARRRYRFLRVLLVKDNRRSALLRVTLHAPRVLPRGCL